MVLVTRPTNRHLFPVTWRSPSECARLAAALRLKAGASSSTPGAFGTGSSFILEVPTVTPANFGLGVYSRWGESQSFESYGQVPYSWVHCREHWGQYLALRIRYFDRAASHSCRSSACVGLSEPLRSCLTISRAGLLSNRRVVSICFPQRLKWSIPRRGR